jgi:hypothetical protein
VLDAGVNGRLLSMSLLNCFKQNIASICDVPINSIQLDNDKIFVGSHELPFMGVFFNQGSSVIQSIDYFGDFKKDSSTTGKILIKNRNNQDLYVRELNVLNQDIDSGVYEIRGLDGSRIVVFTGSISGTSANPDLTLFPEVLIAIAVLGKTRCADSVNWGNILESLGPFVISSTDPPPLLSLGECGLSLRRQQTFSFTWSNSLPEIAQTIKTGIPKEAETAYLAALHDSTTADVAFLRLYRVLEILFAGTYKDEIANADLSKIIALIQLLNSTSELDTLKKLVDKSTLNFTHFTKTDFDTLFPGHRPKGNYAKIANWLNDETSTIPMSEIRALIIYFIRCALVHSKMNEKEPFLIGPFSCYQETALNNLVDDTREIIKSLLY